MARVPLVVSASSAAATVTFCAVAKLAEVNVNVPLPETTVRSASPLSRRRR